MIGPSQAGNANGSGEKMSMMPRPGSLSGPRSTYPSLNPVANVKRIREGYRYVTMLVPNKIFIFSGKRYLTHNPIKYRYPTFVVPDRW